MWLRAVVWRLYWLCLDVKHASRWWTYFKLTWIGLQLVWYDGLTLNIFHVFHNRQERWREMGLWLIFCWSQSNNFTLFLEVIQVFCIDESCVVPRSAATKAVWFVLAARRWGLFGWSLNKGRCFILWLSMHTFIREPALDGLHSVDLNRWVVGPSVQYSRVFFIVSKLGGGRKLSVNLSSNFYRSLYTSHCLLGLRLLVQWHFWCYNIGHLWFLLFWFDKVFDSFLQISLHLVPRGALCLEFFEQSMLQLCNFFVDFF